ncbi:hypothetical protein KC930_03295 [Candidatus Saccharibacteria bacterium]|nr:hypothetical protein [Candidatus Saccharibacteria bacterium]
MSKLIRQLLNESDPRFSHSLARLEYSAGNPGIDVELTAEILSVANAKHKELGLDPKDTTGQELYSALSNKLLESEECLVAYLKHPASSDQAGTAIADLCREIIGKQDAWTIKNTAIKKILKDNPPKKVMKLFHFHSVDSLVKRMDIAEVILAARVVESKTWWSKTKRHYLSLSTQDFEKTPIKIIAPTDVRWISIIEQWDKVKHERVIGSKEVGSLIFSVVPGRGGYISTLLSVLRVANELAVHGSYLKLHYVNPSIGNVLVHTVDDGEMLRGSVSGAVFHWRDVHRYFGLLNTEGDASFVHLDSHDLRWLMIETSLSLRIPEMAFWIGTDIVGVSFGDGRLISMNLLDLAYSAKLNKSYTKMSVSYLQMSLRSELMARYVKFPASRALVLKQFDISDNILEDW